MQNLISLANTDPLARRWGMRCSFDMVLGIGDTLHRVTVRDGEVLSVSDVDRRLTSWDFAIRGPEAAWEAHWAHEPEPGYHDIIAMRTAGHIAIEGNLQTFFANILYVKRLLELPRRAS